MYLFKDVYIYLYHPLQSVYDLKKKTVALSQNKLDLCKSNL